MHQDHVRHLSARPRGLPATTMTATGDRCLPLVSTMLCTDAREHMYAHEQKKPPALAHLSSEATTASGNPAVQTDQPGPSPQLRTSNTTQRVPFTELLRTHRWKADRAGTQLSLRRGLMLKLTSPLQVSVPLCKQRALCCKHTTLNMHKPWHRACHGKPGLQNHDCRQRCQQRGIPLEPSHLLQYCEAGDACCSL